MVLTQTPESAENYQNVICLNSTVCTLYEKYIHILERTEPAAVDVVRIWVLAKADLTQTSGFSLVYAKFSVVKCSLMW